MNTAPTAPRPLFPFVVAYHNELCAGCQTRQDVNDCYFCAPCNLECDRLMNGARADRGPTTADLRPLLDDLAAIYAPGAKSIAEIQHEMRTGTSTRPLDCIIDAGVPQGPLKAALRASGLEMYLTYDGKGGTVVHIRTQQAGNELRQKLRDDRDATRLRHLAHVATEARKLSGTISRPHQCREGHPECSTHVFGHCSVDVDG